MKKARKPYGDVLTDCVWCGKKFSPNDKILALGYKVDKDSNDITKEELRALEGHPINVFFYSPAKEFKACVLYSDDPKFKAGNDIVFYTCSNECTKALLEAIKKSKKLVVSKRHDH